MSLIEGVIFGLFLGGLFLFGLFFGHRIYRWELKQNLQQVTDDCPLKEKYGITPNDGIPTIDCKKLKFDNEP